MVQTEKKKKSYGYYQFKYIFLMYQVVLFQMGVYFHTRFIYINFLHKGFRCMYLGIYDGIYNELSTIQNQYSNNQFLKVIVHNGKITN